MDLEIGRWRSWQRVEWDRLREAIDQAMTLPSPRRERLIAQMGMLSGLWKARNQFKMELIKMPVYIDIDKNIFLAEMKRIGANQGRLEIISRQLERRFGKLPRGRSSL